MDKYIQEINRLKLLNKKRRRAITKLKERINFLNNKCIKISNQITGSVKNENTSK